MCNDNSNKDIKVLVEKFQRLNKSCHGLISYAVKKHEIEFSPEQARLLFIIGTKKITTQREIADKLRITPATLSVRLQRLEKAGYLRREIDPSDKRNYLLEVEPKGIDIVKKTMQVMEQMTQQFFTGFSDSEIQQMISYLERMKQNIENIKEDM